MKRIAFLDYLRAIAIFMVFIVHSCENFYFGEDGGLLLQSPESARKACRPCGGWERIWHGRSKTFMRKKPFNRLRENTSP